MTLKVSLVLLIALGVVISDVASKGSWWETASFYQIYPRSFKDSDGDGIGDLNGVTSRLEYLKEIGIEATWLSPFLESPMADFGYDISNFTAVDPLFGTMEDFEKMMKKANKLNIRIILDFVPNHSSDECEWFIKSANRDPEYKDFYIWHPGKIVDGVRMPPSNWLSVFHGSAWEWHEGRQEYYFHQFHKKQPDFNFRNPKVRETMKDILRFWLDKGISGFRIDAIPHAYEAAPDENGKYLDEPINPEVSNPEEYGHTYKIYTVDQPETPHLVYEWRELLQNYEKENSVEERILMSELWSPIDIVMQYYGNETVPGSQIPFNFLLISNLQRDSDASHYAQLINTWLINMPKGQVANWVIGNHDKNRVGSRYGEERIDMFNILMLTLPGCSVTYMGEEMGMLDVHIPWEETVDPQACNGPKEKYEQYSRDPTRAPFQWNDEKNAGFSDGKSTWLPVSDIYKSVNVKRERGISLSHLAIYKQLQQIRSTTTMESNEAEVKAVNRNVLAIRRYRAGDYTYVILLNIFNGTERINLSQTFSDIAEEFEYVLVTDRSLRRKGDKALRNNITLMPYESIVLRSTTYD